MPCEKRIYYTHFGQELLASGYLHLQMSKQRALFLCLLQNLVDICFRKLWRGIRECDCPVRRYLGADLGCFNLPVQHSSTYIARLLNTATHHVQNQRSNFILLLNFDCFTDVSQCKGEVGRRKLLDRPSWCTRKGLIHKA